MGTREGSLSLIERVEEGSYKVQHRHTMDPGSAIRSVLPVREDSFAILTATGQLLKASMSVGKNKVGVQTLSSHGCFKPYHSSATKVSLRTQFS